MPGLSVLKILRIVLIGLVLWALATAGARALIVRQPLPHPDALLVLAGSRVYGERVAHAAALFRAGNGNMVLLTNDGQRGPWSRALNRNPASIEVATAALTRAGVPLDRIHVLPGTVHGTSDEARAVQRYAQAHSMRSVVAVTSPYHTRRTLWTLRCFLLDQGVLVGIEPVPATPATPAPRTWWSTRNGWRTVGSEFVKLPYYWVRFSLSKTGAD